ncbi:hypothetical protein AB0C38_20400 [Amycolatopsis sp. NPDC048633]|uniref:hypothetical protein n=1 Tax=Amycolatopsis sp. NPDC048633 TaxID=3157095 RepID=UPI0033E137E2
MPGAQHGREQPGRHALRKRYPQRAFAVGGDRATVAHAAGAEVALAGRNPARIDVPGIRAIFGDLGDESSLKALAAEDGELGYLVTLAGAPANGPLMLAKHFAARFREGGAVVFLAKALAAATLQALANPFTTGTVLRVDGAGRLG